MPLAAVIDQDMFCVHGGISRHVSGKGRTNDMIHVPNVVGMNPPYDDEHMFYQKVASDCIGSDPAFEEQERKSIDVTTGFGDSVRGSGAMCFGNREVTDFLQEKDLSHAIRAYEAHADGVVVSKGARVFIVFSTNKDHSQGNEALARCVLVDFEKSQVEMLHQQWIDDYDDGFLDVIWYIKDDDVQEVDDSIKTMMMT